MNSKTIARNTAWYGLENLISFATTFITGIAIARTLGPAKMGYIVYVSLLTSIVGNLGSVGLPETTRKYMAEFIGKKDYPTARFIYLRTFTTQAILASVATLGAMGWVLHDAPQEYRLASLFLVSSMLPAMMNFISAQANVASENLSANLPGSFASMISYFVLTISTVVFHWGVNGIAFAMLAMRLTDFLVRLIPTMRRILRWEGGEVHPPADLRQRMMHFAVQSVMGMMLTLVVWNRFEVFLLKRLSPDIRQLAFYSVAFGLAERLLLFPTIFGSATGTSILAQYGRDRTKLPPMVAAAARYIALIAIPIHLIAVPLAAPALLVLYGQQYIGALLVATVAPVLCMPKAFLGPIQSLFESVEKQKYFLVATVIASFVDIGVAWALIPRYGALGACLGSGAAQITAVSLMWSIGIRKYEIRLPWAFILRLAVISGIASAAAWVIRISLPPLEGLIGGAAAAAVIFMTLAYILRLLEPEDCSRFKVVSNALPGPIRKPFNALIDRFNRRMEQTSTAV